MDLNEREDNRKNNNSEKEYNGQAKGSVPGNLATL